MKTDHVKIATPEYLKQHKPAYENKMCESVGLIATCNACDRIIFADESWMEEYSHNGGYCRECSRENVEQ